jgi:small redox-active disulfide protein 2
MRIKILGSGCSKCIMLADNTRRALDNMGRDAEIVKVTDLAEIAMLGVMSTPGLAIDDVVVSTGRVLAPKSIEDLILAHDAESHGNG